MDTRGLDADVLRGAQVIVEDAEAARREAGDVVIAVEKGALAWDDVVTMAEVVRGEVALDPGRRVVFKTVLRPSGCRGRTWRWRGLLGGLFPRA